ncbi:daptomycin-sensing surface protein LiaX [Lacticaseibacillus zhaodongensis]|uniref:daptomycin-sensing surface protein LiaX n=1 Tax=Lacticaseibacillus zhaodongensis TaxID=2668065 RepID=UPI0012D35650|nr:daptomycin-sensing surface protein LiaX [Lacticaseibacillus zhaodongensis]
MNERERILDLVKKGVLSSEEGLVLLENLAKQDKQNVADAKPATEPKQPEAPQDDSAQPDAPADGDPELDAANKRRAEVKTALDTSAEELAKLRRQSAANDEQIIVYDTMEDLDTLTPEKAQARSDLQVQNAALSKQISALEEKRTQLKQEQSELDRKLRKEDLKSSINRVIPDDWQDQAKSAAADLGKTVSDASSQIGSIVKHTAKTVMDNVDWKDITVRVPGIATQKFTHTFDFPNCAASVLDVNVANGDVQLKAWDEDDIKVEASIRFFGKVDGDLVEEFTQRSRIEADADHFIFQVPNKRIEANLVISLPQRDYDHVALRTLNGDAKMTDVRGKDFFAKTTNGNLRFENLQAVMLEAENVNGDVKAVDATVNSALISTVNGDARLAGRARSAKLSTVNGDVKVTLRGSAKTVNATSVNGDVKVAVPASSGLSGQVKSRFGSIRSRMTGVDTPNKRMRSINLDRAGDGVSVLNLSTVTGEVLLKDTDIEK